MARWLVLVVGAGLVFLLVKQVTSQHPEVTVSPPVTPSSIPKSGKDILLSLCPPKTKTPVKVAKKNVLIISTLDGQLTALDLTKQGEMIWSTPTYPGPMLDSTISQMELDSRGQWVRLIPSLTGNLYKFNGNEVEPMPMDAGGLLSSSLKLQDNFVFTGGKETRTMGIDLKTGELQYECSMDGDCKKFSTETDSDTLKDVLVVQRKTQTVKAHSPRTGDIKWNFSVSLHDVKLVPGQDLCKDVETETAEEDEKEIFNLKTVVPDGVVCAVDQENDDQIKWRRKFQSPIVDVWEINGRDISQLDLFSKNNVKKRESPLLDDDDDPENDESPHLYIGLHNKQLYIQENILMAKEAEQGIHDFQLNPSGSETAFPRVSWKPYLVSPSRTPYFDLGATQPDLPLISFDQHLERTDSKTTSLAIINSDKAEYPLDSGFYLYQDRTGLDTNMTTELMGEEEEEEIIETITVQFIYMNLWHWWKEVVFISMVTALLMNLLIYRPLVHEMRDNFQQRSRDLVTHFQAQLVKSENEAANQVKEKIVVVEVPVHVPMSNSNNTASTPLTPSTGSSDKSLFSTQLSGQTNDFTSRYLSDFEPLQCLGRGGFGVVFESKNKYDDIHYAVKRITLPSSEERRRKVKREVRVLAKLEHRNIVRYFSTWEETPPVGWQEAADSWLDDFDVGSGPTPYDPTSTDVSVASSVGRRKGNVGTNNNPLDPFRGFPSDNTAEDKMFPSMGENSASCDIVFENSDAFSNSDRRHDRLGWGGDSACEIEFENSSSVVFEENGLSEAVSLQIDSTSSSDGSNTNSDHSSRSEEGSLSCVEAIEWDDNRTADEESRKSEKKGTQTEKKQRAYLYIVMQLCLKDTLRDWLRQHGGEERKREEVLDIFRQICVGVQYVHKQGLIHRDLKPSNIYFSTEGVIKIGDFGLVTNTELEPETGVSGDQKLSPFKNTPAVNNKNGQLTDQVGTQMYMSPEQLKQMPYGHKVDIFSLGLIFFELLAPFSTQMERLCVMSDAKKGHYPPHLASGVERELLDSMLHTRPDLRPEVGQILTLGWLQEEVGGRRRHDTLTSHQDILCEEILDN